MRPGILRDDVDELFSFDYRDESAARSFAEQVLKPLRPAAVVSVTEHGLDPAALMSGILGIPAVPLAVVRAMLWALLAPIWSYSETREGATAEFTGSPGPDQAAGRLRPAVERE
ncbi:hypothetical protein ACIRYZ_45905 [Kitasatospora sp. NPDC101155]|uniref:hypothetical protein n=1 Tax=Kitasatospora sp. NPDC101155 TaxID=3364097 RepID=UPI0038048D18